MTGRNYDDTHWEDLMAVFSRPEADRVHLSDIDDHSIARNFRQAISHLGRIFTISKASLAMMDSQSCNLQVTHIYDKGLFHSNVTVLIDVKTSMLYQTLMQGFPVVDNYPELITTNIIEKKILLSPGVKSVLVIPLIHDGVPFGVLNLASRAHCAFGLYLEGAGESIVAELAETLAGTGAGRPQDIV